MVCTIWNYVTLNTVSSQRSPETVSDTLVRCLACIDIGP